MAQDKGAPYVVFVLGEIERMNKILSSMYILHLTSYI